MNITKRGYCIGGVLLGATLGVLATVYAGRDYIDKKIAAMEDQRKFEEESNERLTQSYERCLGVLESMPGYDYVDHVNSMLNDREWEYLHWLQCGVQERLKVQEWLSKEWLEKNSPSVR